MLHYYQMALTILELITDLNSRVLQPKFETPRYYFNLSDVFIRNTPGFFDGIPELIRGVFDLKTPLMQSDFFEKNVPPDPMKPKQPSYLQSEIVRSIRYQ